MYSSLAVRLGLDYLVVNPSDPRGEDLSGLKEIDLLVIAPGYLERVRESYSGDIIEAGVRTLSQLKESAELIVQASGLGDVEPLARELDRLLKRFAKKRKSQGRSSP